MTASTSVQVEPGSVEALGEDVLRRDHRAIARAITMVESGQGAGSLHASLFSRTGRAFTIGITGPPGAGKSTLVDQIVAHYRAAGISVGVLAVDPSSPFSRGALLGDRVRMRSYVDDPEVFVRSMANRGHVGGLALATPAAIRILDAAGFERIVVETVGVGQSEVDVVGAVDCTVVVEVPGMGDTVQTMKAGLMEIADQFVVNKADREGAERLARELRRMMREQTGRRDRSAVVTTAAHQGRGVPELVEAIEAFRERQADSGELVRRRRENLVREVAAFVGEHARRVLLGEDGLHLSGRARADLYERRRDPESLAVDIVGSGLKPVPDGRPDGER